MLFFLVNQQIGLSYLDKNPQFMLHLIRTFLDYYTS